MRLNQEQPGKARAARRHGLALALGCLIALVQAAPAMAAPLNLAPPDTPQRTGRTLTTENGSWLLANSFSYAWFRCDSAGSGCSQVPGRVEPSYLLTTADIGRRIRSRVTASDGLGTSSAFSPATADIAAAAPVNQVRPAVSGVPRSGSALSSTLGSWSDPSPAAVSYRRQWQRCAAAGFACQDIAGATGASYTLGADDVGRFMRVSVTAEGLGSSLVESPPLGPVLDPPGTGRPGGGPAPGAPAPSAGPRKLRPFPRVVLAGRLLRGRTHISQLVVKGPRGATVSVRCRGRGCRSRSFRAKLGRSKRLRLRRFQRTYAPRAVIEIRVTGPQAIGKYTRIGIRATRPPSRRDSCLAPGASRPSRCP